MTSEPLDAPRLTNRWLMLALLLGIALLNYADRYLLSGLVGPIKAEFKLTDNFMGLLMGPAFALLYTVAAIPIARLADRTSRVAVVCAGCVVWSFFTALTSLADSPWMLAAARVGVSVGEAAYQAPAAALIAAYFPPHQRTRALALVSTSIYFGQITGMAGGPAIAAVHGWRAAFELLGVTGIIIGVTAWIVIREPQRSAPVQSQTQVSLKSLAGRLPSVASVRNMTLGLGLGTLSGVSFGMWGPSLFERAYALPNAEAGKTFGIAFGLPGLIGMLAFGVLADRMAKKGVHRPLMLSAAALFAATLLIMVVTWSPSLALARLLAIPSGLLGGGWSIGIIAGLQYVLPERFRSTGTAGALMVVGLFGNLLGPWGTGALSDAFGGDPALSLRLGLSIMIPTGLIGAFLLLRAARTLEADQAALDAWKPA